MAIITFLICSHQAPPSLDAALASIARQHDVNDAQILVINNGFPASRAAELKANFSSLHLHILDEPRPGLGFARRAGFAAATGRMLVLLDDDNTIGPAFVSNLLEDIQNDGTLGAVIPVIEPVWESPPPPWVIDFGRKCLSYNAAGTLKPEYSDQQYWSAGTVKMSIRPPGGGMIIAAAVARHYLATVNDARRISLARQPTSLVGCEDEDIFRGVPQLNLSAKFDQRLKVFHHIPASRTKLKYLLRLNLQMCYSYGMLYGYVKPQAKFSLTMEATRLLRNSAGSLKEVLAGHMPIPQSLLELSRDLGWSAGRWQYTREHSRRAA